jgi:HSP20 family protein
MVERSHTAGWWPAVYEPIKRAGEKIAEWFAPRSEAAVSTDNYRISMELPGVAAHDIEISMQDGTLVVRGEKRSERQQEGGQLFLFPLLGVDRGRNGNYSPPPAQIRACPI